MNRLICDAYSRLDMVFSGVCARKHSYLDQLKAKLMEPVLAELTNDVEEYLDALNKWRPIVQDRNPNSSCTIWIGSVACPIKGWNLGYNQEINDKAIHIKAQELASKVNRTVESLDVPIINLFLHSGKVDLTKRVGSFIVNFPEFKPLLDYKSKVAKLTKTNYYRDQWLRALSVDETYMKEQGDKINHLAAMMFL